MLLANDNASFPLRLLSLPAVTDLEHAQLQLVDALPEAREAEACAMQGLEDKAGLRRLAHDMATTPRIVHRRP